jgi:hypothetical protein
MTTLLLWTQAAVPLSTNGDRNAELSNANKFFRRPSCNRRSTHDMTALVLLWTQAAVPRHGARTRLLLAVNASEQQRHAI